MNISAVKWVFKCVRSVNELCDVCLCKLLHAADWWLPRVSWYKAAGSAVRFQVTPVQGLGVRLCWWLIHQVQVLKETSQNRARRLSQINCSLHRNQCLQFVWVTGHSTSFYPVHRRCVRETLNCIWRQFIVCLFFFSFLTECLCKYSSKSSEAEKKKIEKEKKHWILCRAVGQR